MARYIARFMKGVLGENGHESEICQRSVEIEAPNKEHAAELAKVKFCRVRKCEELVPPCGSCSHHGIRVFVLDVGVKAPNHAIEINDATGLAL